MEYNNLTKEEKKVILEKGTEAPYSGKYYKFDKDGTYLCKRCDAPLFESNDKFDAHCGWPSFDDAIEGAVKRVPDADGRRTEILCANCGAHLGHVFTGEGYTPKNTRYCVNSISLNFADENEEEQKDEPKEAFFAAGCFWGVEHYFAKLEGVLDVQSGYSGGDLESPSYQDVASGKTDHAETVMVKYDSEKVSYKKLVKYFFEIHDFTQVNRQGPDIGEQYRSAIFYRNNEEKETAKEIIKILKNKGYEVATELNEFKDFWQAEDYHQDYYQKHNKLPYCHTHRKIFED